MVLIDFQHLLDREQKIFKEFKSRLDNPKHYRGTNKRNRPAPYTWDDMYSFYNVMKQFEKYNLNGFQEKTNKIKARIGDQVIYFLANKFKLKAYFNYNCFIFYKIFWIFQKIFDRKNLSSKNPT
ncbi:MAG: hypothetical protein MZV64_26390 [Ignavibacteriales bacterium]|nr:hypothetical protein [Ignavibacteriales bacterium]